MESHALPRDPQVKIHCCFAGSDEEYKVAAFDTSTGKSYGVAVKTNEEILDTEWLSDTIEMHIRQHSVDHEGTIETNTGDPSSAISIWPRSKLLPCGDDDMLPLTTWDTIKDLNPLDIVVYRCRWNGQDCVLKYIETDDLAAIMEWEIDARKSFRNTMSQIPRHQVNSVMSRRFCVVPILAVVKANPPLTKICPTLGIIMPYSGESLGALRRKNELCVTLHQLQDLIRGVWELAKLGQVHGNINVWNTLLQSSTEAEEPCLTLVDFGYQLKVYSGDATALARLLLWCHDSVPVLSEDKQATRKLVDAAAALLKGSFSKAIDHLSTTNEIDVEPTEVTQSEFEAL